MSKVREKMLFKIIQHKQIRKNACVKKIIVAIK